MAVPTPVPQGVLKVKTLSPAAKKAVKQASGKRPFKPAPHLTQRPFASLDIRLLTVGIKH